MRRGERPASGKWFVGRVSELAAIGACVDAVSGGAGRGVWVAGGPFAVLEQLGVEGGGSPQAVGLDLVALLTEAGGGGPVAVVVEDLHWADRESRQALLTVVRRVGEG